MEVDAGSAVVEVVVTVAIRFCGGCFYIILKYCIYYFKWSGKNRTFDVWCIVKWNVKINKVGFLRCLMLKFLKSFIWILLMRYPNMSRLDPLGAMNPSSLTQSTLFFMNKHNLPCIFAFSFVLYFPVIVVYIVRVCLNFKDDRKNRKWEVKIFRRVSNKFSL